MQLHTLAITFHCLLFLLPVSIIEKDNSSCFLVFLFRFERKSRTAEFVPAMLASTCSRVVTMVAPTRSRVVTMVAPTRSRVVTSQPNPPQCAALSFIFSASHPEHLPSSSISSSFVPFFLLLPSFSFTKNLLYQILFCQAISLQQVTVASSIYALIVFFFPKQLLCRH